MPTLVKFAADPGDSTTQVSSTWGTVPSTAPSFSVLHFNDAHNLYPARPTEPFGGATRFATLVKKYRAEKDCLVFFSGDIFSPSRLTTVTKGKHVPPFLKALKVDCGCYGNHDFAFGPRTLEKLAGLCDMPWVMTNLVDVSVECTPVANAHKSLLINKNGISIGVIGIVEEEWLATIRNLPEWVVYIDKVLAAKQEIESLKERGAQVIIALTHMREYNDIAFMREVPEVDLVLGGHDHFYKVTNVDGVTLIKSGSDFVYSTLLDVWVLPSQGPDWPRTQVISTQIPISSSIKEDEDALAALADFDQILASKLSKEVCYLANELDITSAIIRCEEAAAGNLVADIIREEMGCDLALINSGLLRADLVYSPGALKLKDLIDIIPMEDLVVSILVSGRCLREALECGFSKYPALEGRFPQLSGMKVIVDTMGSPMKRVQDVSIEGTPLDDDLLYSLATTNYLSNGGDGYTPLKQHEGYIVEPGNGQILPTMVRQYLMDLPEKQRSAELRRFVSLKGFAQPKPTIARHKTSGAEAKRNRFLPVINPVVEGRIVLKSRAEPPQSFTRLLSSLNPIPIERTITSLTANRFLETSQDDLPQWNSDEKRCLNAQRYMSFKYNYSAPHPSHAHPTHGYAHSKSESNAGDASSSLTCKLVSTTPLTCFLVKPTICTAQRETSPSGHLSPSHRPSPSGRRSPIEQAKETPCVVKRPSCNSSGNRIGDAGATAQAKTLEVNTLLTSFELYRDSGSRSMSDVSTISSPIRYVASFSDFDSQRGSSVSSAHTCQRPVTHDELQRPYSQLPTVQVISASSD